MIKSYKYILCLVLLLYCNNVLNSATFELKSPNNRLSLIFQQTGADFSYTLKRDNIPVVSNSPISITVGGVDYPNASIVMSSLKNITVDGTLRPEVRLKCEEFRELYSELEIGCGSNLKIRARAYNDAVAFRWETLMNDTEIIVNNEKFTIDLSNYSLNAWIPQPGYDGEIYFSHQECMYVYKEINRVYDPFCAPLLIDLKNGLLMLSTDTNTDHFPGMWLRGENGKFETAFPAYPKTVELVGSRSMQVKERESFIAKIPGKHPMPWRVLMVTDAKGLLESNTLYSLAEPNRIGDTSWIKPGKVSWDWWNNFTIGNVGFTPGVNQQTYKFYIDFAAENGLPYVLLDEGWSYSKPEQFLQVVPALDMPELSAYAQSKGVKLILWTTSTSLEGKFTEAFEKFTEWGIAGIKVDFLQRDDQVMNEFCYRVAEEAAKRKLLVDFHGGSKPTGLQRTFPNVLTHESVRGMEQSLWNTKANPDMAVMNAFVRMSVGPMDYTPGAMVNMTKENFVPAKNTDYQIMGSMGTRCQQLAMYVVYNSPLQMLCDSPARYRENSSSLAFLKVVPTVWDETIALFADPAQGLAMAKRNGNRWFIGSLTNSVGRTIQLNLSFLPKGKNFNLKSWSDGENANTDAKDNVVSEQIVNSTSKINVKMTNGGGYAAIITEKIENTDNIQPEKANTIRCYSGKNLLKITVEEAQKVVVINMFGIEVCSMHVSANETVSVELQPGIYLVNREKIVVK